MSESFSLFNRFKLRDIVRSIKDNGNINKNTEFLRKYDNGNSIWEKAEIAQIRNDYNSGKLDNLYNKCNENFNPQNSSYGYNYSLNKELSELTTEQQKRAAELLNINALTQNITTRTILKIVNVDDDRYKIIKGLMDKNINNPVNCGVWDALTELSIDDIKTASDYIFIEERNADEQFDDYYIKQWFSIDKTKRERLEPFLRINGRDTQLPISAILTYFNKLPDNVLGQIMLLANLKFNGKERFSSFDFYTRIGDTELKKLQSVQDLICIDNRKDKQFSLQELLLFSEKEPEELDIIRNRLVYIEELDDNQFSYDDINNLLNLSSTELSELPKLIRNYKNREPKFKAADYYCLAQMSEDELKKISPYIMIEGLKENQLEGQVLSELAKLDDKQLETFNKHLSEKINGEIALGGDDLIEISKLPEDELAQIERFIHIKNLTKQPDNLITVKNLATEYADDFETMQEIVEINPNVACSTLLRLSSLLKINKNATIKFYKNHHDEDLNIYADTIIIVDIFNNSVCEFDPAQNTITETKSQYNYDVQQIKSQKIQRFDDQGNLIQTKTISPGGIDFVPNITVAKGDSVQQIQYSSIDPNSGNIIISKELELPNNVKSEYYLEKTPDGDLILNYIIDGPKNLKDDSNKESAFLNRNLCFMQLSENKFLTVINDKSYETEFNDNLILVTNLVTGDKKELNINKLADDEKSRELLINILKRIPANLLMSINNDDFKFKYHDDILNMANCEAISNACLIEMGDKLTSDDNKINDAVATFLHEFGHRLDCDTSLDNESDAANRFSLITNDELLTQIHKEEVEYFIANTDTITQDSAGYLAYNLDEMVAETNLFLNSIPNIITTNRITVIQEYFPRTIARITELLDNRIDELTKKAQ